MRKTLIVASTEFGNSIRGRVFIISLVLMPLLWGGAVALQNMMMERADTAERRVAVVDETGLLVGRLERAAAEQNRSAVSPSGKVTGPRFVIVHSPADRITDEERARLSDEVRAERLFAFVEIPASVMQVDAGPARVAYYSNSASYEAMSRWLQATIGTAVVNERFRQASVDRALIDKLTTPISLENLGLVERDASGRVKAAEHVDEFRAVGVPMVLMFLVFLPVMFITPQLINTVLEEKMSRISEVLLGSVKPFELMLGKLLGAGGVSLVLALTYMGGAYGAAVYFGYGDVVTPLVLVEFAIFLALAMLLFGSLYLAVGSACSTLKDAQSLAMPVGLISVLPMMLIGAIMKAPDGPLAVALSFFPFSSPYIMLMRAAFSPPAPLWQVALSILTTGATTVGVVWAGSRIFRVGLLMYGKPPSFGELIRWVRA